MVTAAAIKIDVAVAGTKIKSNERSMLKYDNILPPYTVSNVTCDVYTQCIYC